MEAYIELLCFLAVVIVILSCVLGWTFLVPDSKERQRRKSAKKRQQREIREQEQAEKDERLDELEDQNDKMKAEAKQLTTQLTSVQRRHKKQLEVNRKQEIALAEKDMRLQTRKEQQDEAEAKLDQVNKLLDLANQRNDTLAKTLAKKREELETKEDMITKKDVQLQCLEQKHAEIVEAGETKQRKLQREKEQLVKELTRERHRREAGEGNLAEKERQILIMEQKHEDDTEAFETRRKMSYEKKADAKQRNEELFKDNMREKRLREGAEKSLSDSERRQDRMEQRLEDDLEAVNDILRRERQQKTEAKDEVELLQRKCATLQMCLRQSQRDLEDSQLYIARHKRNMRDEDLLDVIALRGPARYAHEGDTHRLAWARETRCGPPWTPWTPSNRYDDDDPVLDWLSRPNNNPRRHEDSKERIPKQREDEEEEHDDEQVVLKAMHGEDLENMEAKIKKANQEIADVKQEKGQLRKELEKAQRTIDDLERKNREKVESLALGYYQQSRNDQIVNQTHQTAVLEAEDNHDNDPSVDEPLTGSAVRYGANSTGEQLDDQRVESQPLALSAPPNDNAFSHQNEGVNNDDDLTPAQGSADVVDMQTPVPAQDTADVDMQMPDSVPVPQMPSMRSRNHSLHRSFSWPQCELDGVEPRSRTVSCSINGSVSSIPSCNLESLEGPLISEESH